MYDIKFWDFKIPEFYIVQALKRLHIIVQYDNYRTNGNSNDKWVRSVAIRMIIIVQYDDKRLGTILVSACTIIFGLTIKQQTRENTPNVTNVKQSKHLFKTKN